MANQGHITQVSRQFAPRPNRGRGFNHNNSSNPRGYNNDRNPPSYSGVKVHYNSNNNMGSGGGGYQNQSRYPIMPVRHYTNTVPSNVTLAPMFSLSNQLIPTPAANHVSQNQFSAISNQTAFDEPGHGQGSVGLLQNPGQSFEPSAPPQQQQNQQLMSVRSHSQWSNGGGIQNGGLPVMDQHVSGIEMNGLGGENTIGNYQSQQQQQFPPPQQTTYYGGYNQFGGAGQNGYNPNVFYPPAANNNHNNFNPFYGNTSTPNYFPGYGFGQPPFMNPAAYSPYGNGNAAAGNGQGQVITYICSICKQSSQIQAGGDQLPEIAVPEKASSATESTQE